MKIMVLVNPISGSGRAARAGREFAEALNDAGHETVLTPTRLESTSDWLRKEVKDVDLVVVAGGDGAVRIAAGALNGTDVPMYHVPYGTENLFAREFRMDREPATLIRAIEQHNVQRVDLGLANGRPFLLMASLGLDADVVHDLHKRRGSSISQLTYVLPVLRQFTRWRPHQLQITVDGERIDREQPGFVIVANCKQYGFRFNPAANADMKDGLLDVVFFPAQSRRDFIRWAVRCQRKTHVNHPKLSYVRGKDVRIACDEDTRYQLDGDVPSIADSEPSKPLKLHITIKPAAVSVLVP